MVQGRVIDYSEAELAWIKRNRALPRKEAHERFCEVFSRDDVSFENYKALCTRKGWLTGRDGRIQKGSESWNKGRKCPPGEGGNHPNARKTQFKQGTRQGVATKLYKPIGTERLTKEGYLERKIHDGMPLQSRWRAVHLVRWEEVNDKLPKGMCLKCLDGNRQNTDPANWVAIPRGMLPFLNGHRGHNYDAMPDELKPSVLTLAKLKHARSDADRKPLGPDPMTPAAFIQTVCLLWGDHWQKPFIGLLAERGHTYTRQQLWNWKTGGRPVPGHVEAILKAELKQREIDVGGGDW